LRSLQLLQQKKRAPVKTSKLLSLPKSKVEVSLDWQLEKQRLGKKKKIGRKGQKLTGQAWNRLWRAALPAQLQVPLQGSGAGAEKAAPTNQSTPTRMWRPLSVKG